MSSAEALAEVVDEEPLDSDDELPVVEAAQPAADGDDDDNLYPAARSLKDKGDNSYHYWHGHKSEAPPPVPCLLKTGETAAPEPLADGLKLKSGTAARCHTAAQADPPPRLLPSHLSIGLVHVADRAPPPPQTYVEVVTTPQEVVYRHIKDYSWADDESYAT
jgi:hypothetical protein